LQFFVCVFQHMSDIEHADILEILARQQMVTGTSEMTFRSIAARLSGGGNKSSQLKNSLDSLRRRGLVLLNLRGRNSNQNQGGGTSSFLYSLNSPFLLQKAVELKGYTAPSSSTTRDDSSGAQVTAPGRGRPLSAVEKLFLITPLATHIFRLYDWVDSQDWLRLASVSSEWHDLCRKREHMELIHFKPRGTRSKDGKVVQLVKSLPGLRHLDFTEYNKIENYDLKQLQSLTNLESLNLSRCKKITEQGLRMLLPLKNNLQSLNLSGCDYIGIENPYDFKILNEFKKLRSLDLSSPSFNNLRQLSPLLPELQSLKLSNCVWITAGDLTSAFSRLHPSKKLQSLDLSHIPTVDDNVLRKVMSSLPGLKHLSVSSCKKVRLETPLPLLPSLESLDLSNCKRVTETRLRATVQSGVLNNLKHLDLSWILDPNLYMDESSLTSQEKNGNLTDVTMTETLPFLSKLQSLNLAGNNRITDRGLQTLLSTNLPDLRRLDIENCKGIRREGLDRAIQTRNVRNTFDQRFLQVKRSTNHAERYFEPWWE